MIGSLSRVAVTLVVVAVAAVIGWQLWTYYTLSPWTRDARILANVVHVAPDVSGPISAIHVKDNQKVAKGDLLFEIDPERFQAALDHAQADVAMRTAALQLARENARRFDTPPGENSLGAAMEIGAQWTTAVTEAEAALLAAEASRAVAQINMRRSKVHAPASGHVTNLTTVAGDFASTGKGVLALVDPESFYVYGYFMETKLPQIQEGARARVELMAGNVVLEGVVEGVSRAIANPDDARGLLADVNPQFSWIRLAQRIPVRVKLGELPQGVSLSSGMSATVVVLPQHP